MMALKSNMTVDEAVAYLEMLARTVTDDIEPLLCTKGGAPFAIAREVMCYIDHLGSLMCGRKGKAKKFIKKYMTGEKDQAYRQWGSALYEMYRHGTVHNFEPCKLTNGEEELVWQAYSGDRQCRVRWEALGFEEDVTHLSRIHRDGKLYSLPVSTMCLIADLKEAIELFKNDLQANSTLLRKWNKYSDFVSQPKKMSKDWQKPVYSGRRGFRWHRLYEFVEKLKRGAKR